MKKIILISCFSLLMWSCGEKEPSQEEKVHPSTLKVVLEEWSKKGNEVPADLFWLFEGKQTKLKNKQ